MKDITNIAQQHGFTLISSEELSEIDGVAHTMLHEASGAKLLYLQNEDPQKAFSISFKTPAADDTGVFHILEHSVLCGSRKFSVKEPFVNLLKSSMQTFLNALTFPDKTMYPVASTNERDLMNLMDVYLDAVFHPAIYTKETIFEQEGWHLELADEPCSVKYNGVVYNEMRGALSDPDAVLFDALAQALFPDTTYRFESGGTPEHIPDLTYADFLNNHRCHYRTDNSYITLYGGLDLDAFLGFIDENYLTPSADMSETEAQENEKISGENDDPVGAENLNDAEAYTLNPLTEQAPVECTGVQKRMVTTPENACAALGFVIGTVQERQRLIATDILLDAIMGSNEAPMKRALLDADIAADALAFVNDMCYQPFAVVQVKGLKPNSIVRLREIVEEQARMLADGGLDHDLVEAALFHAEFVMRERDFGYPDGVVLAMSALSGWLYDDALSTTYLRYEDIFADLRTKIAEGYFEQLLRELFLDNDHFAEVEVVPTDHVETSESDKRLITLSQNMTSEDKEAIEKDVADLRVAQEMPDDPQDVAKLPQLKVSDIGPAPAEGSFEQEDSIFPCLRHHITTRGIAYAYRYFELSQVTFEELPYVTVLALVLGKLGTTHHSASEIDTLVQSKLGNLNFFVEVYEDMNDREAYVPKFVASASSLSENAEYLTTLVCEVLLESDFSDHMKIQDILMQRRLEMEQGCAMAGHVAAMARVTSYYLPAGVVREQLNGMDFYCFLKDLCEHFDERRESLEAKLHELTQRLFADTGCLLSYTGTDEDLKRIAAAGEEFGNWCTRKGDTARNDESKLIAPAPVNKHEAFVVPSDVSFTSMGYDRRLFDGEYSGAWLLASRVLSYDFLWNEVRVKGGAYGAGMQMTRPGSMQFYSYRDPHIDKTIEHYCEAGKWLSSFSPSASEMDGYVVSTTAGMDAPLKPRELIRRQDGMFFSGYTMEERLRIRDQIITSSLEDVQALGCAVSRATEQGLSCTVGAGDIIDRSKEDFNVVDILSA